MEDCMTRQDKSCDETIATERGLQDANYAELKSPLSLDLPQYTTN